MALTTATRTTTSTRALAALVNILAAEIAVRETRRPTVTERRELALVTEAHRALAATWTVYCPTLTPLQFAQAFDNDLAFRGSFTQKRLQAQIDKHMGALLEDITGALAAFITPSIHCAHLMEDALVAA